MQSSEAEALATRLLGRPVAAAEQVVGRGANNRIFAIRLVDGSRVALKCYPSPEHDPRQRLDHEYRALAFLADHGEAAVPRPLARDDAAGVALYQWIDGERPAATAEAIDAMAGFLSRLHALSRRQDAAALSEAAEACLSEAEILRQLNGRFARLRAVEGEPGLSALLDELAPALDRTGDVTSLPAALRSLSPSDFGLHNALATAEQTLFIDFEYFGWDDPVKLVSDVLWHPGMELDAVLGARFRGAMTAVYGAADPDFAARLERFHKLFGLRWILIILNEFLPERWAVRAHAGASDQAAAKRAQLDKAHRWWARVRALS